MSSSFFWENCVRAPSTCPSGLPVGLIATSGWTRISSPTARKSKGPRERSGSAGAAARVAARRRALQLQRRKIRDRVLPVRRQVGYTPASVFIARGNGEERNPRLEIENESGNGKWPLIGRNRRTERRDVFFFFRLSYCWNFRTHVEIEIEPTLDMEGSSIGNGLALRGAPGWHLSGGEVHIFSSTSGKKRNKIWERHFSSVGGCVVAHVTTNNSAFALVTCFCVAAWPCAGCVPTYSARFKFEQSNEEEEEEEETAGGSGEAGGDGSGGDEQEGEEDDGGDDNDQEGSDVE